MRFDTLTRGAKDKGVRLKMALNVKTPVLLVAYPNEKTEDTNYEIGMEIYKK